jgi:hypothetical protein
MKRNILIVLAIAVSALAITAWLSAPPVAHAPYAFGHLIGDIVEHDADWWEIVARMEHRSEVDGNIYPWYKLSRPNKGKTEEIWVWACPVDNDDALALNGGTKDDCCPEPPPDCPVRPC